RPVLHMPYQVSDPTTCIKLHDSVTDMLCEQVAASLLVVVGITVETTHLALVVPITRCAVCKPQLMDSWTCMWNSVNCWVSSTIGSLVTAAGVDGVLAVAGV